MLPRMGLFTYIVDSRNHYIQGARRYQQTVSQPQLQLQSIPIVGFLVNALYQGMYPLIVPFYLTTSLLSFLSPCYPFLIFLHFKRVSMQNNYYHPLT